MRRPAWEFSLPGWRSGGLLVFGLVAGFLLGAFVWSSFLDSAPRRGAVIKLGPPASMPSLATTPFCVPSQHICVVKDGERLLALYTYDTHPIFRSEGCEVRWRPDFEFTDPETNRTTKGWFRSGCSGSTFRMNGERVFGPAARDLDRFPLTIVEDRPGISHIEVDTRHLICVGNRIPGIPCEYAPLPG